MIKVYFNYQFPGPTHCNGWKINFDYVYSVIVILNYVNYLFYYNLFSMRKV